MVRKEANGNMKKAYMKPVMVAESFALSEHISAGCGYVTTFGNQCPIDEGGVTFFVTAESCSADADLLWSGAGVDQNQRTVENLKLLNVQCYNTFADFNQLFTSA